MAENEIHFRNTDDCIKKIKSIRTMYRDTTPSYVALSDAIQALEEIQQYRAIGTVEEVKMLKDYKELYDVYNLIGTIEEFRNLKYKKTVLPIATIEISKEDMQKIVDEKVAQIELNIQEIRANAIDEFFQELQKYEEDDMWLRLKMSSIYEISEQLKEGGINE